MGCAKSTVKWRIPRNWLRLEPKRICAKPSINSKHEWRYEVTASMSEAIQRHKYGFNNGSRDSRGCYFRTEEEHSTWGDWKCPNKTRHWSRFRLGQHGVIFWKELTQGITRMRFPDILGKLRLKINASRIAQAWFKFERIRSRARPLSLSESTRTEGWRQGKNLL